MKKYSLFFILILLLILLFECQMLTIDKKMYITITNNTGITNGSLYLRYGVYDNNNIIKDGEKIFDIPVFPVNVELDSWSQSSRYIITAHLDSDIADGQAGDNEPQQSEIIDSTQDSPIKVNLNLVIHYSP